MYYIAEAVFGINLSFGTTSGESGRKFYVRPFFQLPEIMTDPCHETFLDIEKTTRPVRDIEDVRH